MPIGNSLAIIRSASLKIKQWLVSTFAGKDGLFYHRYNEPLFDYPVGIYTDSSGDVYVTEYGNSTVRKILADGRVQSIYINSYEMKNPTGITTNNSLDHYYVTDTFTSHILKIKKDGTVKTLFAGSTVGFFNGIGAVAKFNTPTGITMDSSGNLYVCDLATSTIRKIAPDSTVSTFAGIPGTSGSIDGAGNLATFNSPYGITIDSSGNLYVVEQGGKKIRKITQSGVVSTLAGTGVAGSRDGAGNVATFNFPTGITIDSSGNLYVCDQRNNKIRKITPSGVVSTFAGTGVAGNVDGTNSTATFNWPNGITIDSSDNLYVADYSSNLIRKITPSGNVSTYCGGTIDKAAMSTLTDTYVIKECALEAVQGITKDSNDNLYVTEEAIVSKITPNGIRKKIAGLIGYDSTKGAYRGYIGNDIDLPSFSSPSNVVVDSFGNLYITESNLHAIRKITPNGIVSTFAGSGGGGAGSLDGEGVVATFFNPIGITIDSSNNLYVVDSSNHRIRKITPDGFVSTVAGSTAGFLDAVGTAAKFSSPTHIAIDSSGNLYVTENGNHKIRKIAPDGTVTTFAGVGILGYVDGGRFNARFNYPLGIAVDSSGNVYVADSANNKIRKIDPISGQVSTLASTATTGSVDYRPYGITINSSNEIYVSITGNTLGHTIIKVASNGTSTTFAGSTKGFADGASNTAKFDNPNGLVFDNSNNMYVCDLGNYRIRKITSSGSVSTYSGIGVRGGNNTNSKKRGMFTGLAGITIDSDENLYVCDRGNHTIRKILPNGQTLPFAGDLIKGVNGFVDGIGSEARFDNPMGITIDSSNNLYVADNFNKAIRKITPSGVVTTFKQYTGTDELRPLQITIDSNGNLYHTMNATTSSSTNYHKIYKLSPSGDLSIFAGEGTAGFLDGSYNIAMFKNPTWLYCDSEDNIFVSDNYNCRIRKITQSGMVSTIAGLGTSAITNGFETVANFRKIRGLTINSLNEIFVADDNVIRKIKKI